MLTFIVFTVLVFVVYSDLPRVYFQQDEWHFFGWMLRLRDEGLFAMLTSPFTTSVRPLSQIVFQFLFKGFGLNEYYYNLFSLFVHLINSFLVYVIASKITKNRTVALISATFFALNSSHLQAIAWIGASVGSLFSIFFGLLSLYTFLDYLEGSNRKRYFQTLVLLVVSMGFKETTLSLFLVYPVIAYFLKDRKNNVVKVVKEYWSMLLIGILWIFQRMIPILFVHTSGPYLTAGGDGASFLPKVIANTFLYPLQGISQVFLSPKAMFGLTSSIMKIVKPILFNNDLFIQTIGKALSP